MASLRGPLLKATLRKIWDEPWMSGDDQGASLTGPSPFLYPPKNFPSKARSCRPTVPIQLPQGPILLLGFLSSNPQAAGAAEADPGVEKRQGHWLLQRGSKWAQPGLPQAAGMGTSGALQAAPSRPLPLPRPGALGYRPSKARGPLYAGDSVPSPAHPLGVAACPELRHWSPGGLRRRREPCFQHHPSHLQTGGRPRPRRHCASWR